MAAEENASMHYDAVVVGGGPAGLTAALYLARARFRVVVVERERFGGQIAITSEVVNYPGVARTSGAELGQTMRRQAESFGAEFLAAEVTGIEAAGDTRVVRTTRGELRAHGVLLATGAHPRRVGFAGEDEFRGHGVAYCATCDGEFFTGKDVFVIGGGFAAAEESVFLTTYARHVTVLMRKGDFSCAPAAAQAARANPKITVMPFTEVDEVSGDALLRRLRAHNNQTGQEFVYEAPEGDTFGVFVLAGYEPESALAQGLAVLDGGYVVTDAEGQTATPGVFAAGDVCVKRLRQVATAVGDGATAADAMIRWCAQERERTGVVPAQPAPSVPEAPTPAAKPAVSAPGALLDDAMRAQLAPVFARMGAPLALELHLDGSSAARELEGYAAELAGMTDKLSVTHVPADAEADHAGLPYVALVRADGKPCGMRFHGVPGGHEFTSFVLGLYNAAGPGQPLDDAARSRIAGIGRAVSLKVIVSLSCTMCPELVQAANRVAALNPLVSVDVYDVAHFPALKEAYDVMSVPCLVACDDSGERVSFGRKTLDQLLDYLG